MQVNLNGYITLNLSKIYGFILDESLKRLELETLQPIKPIEVKQDIKRTPQTICMYSPRSDIDKFWQWKSTTGKEKMTQLQRYEKKNASDGIVKIIAIGGGPKMGTTLEEYARFRFDHLQKRSKGKCETGYDHLIKLNTNDVFVEQKSSGHWGEDDYKWQHVEYKHKWTMLLLCGIDYMDVKFWGMDRKTFSRLISEKKITNQGNKAGESSEGMWFNYSDVKESLCPIDTDEELLQFASSLPVSDV
uniref:Uncharacterized protein n=1 Tax=viral metagenome TaxID=1070528 RepID=A0A6C0JWL8_9ZZZZ